MNRYLEVLKKYAVFSGRARRKEYWFFFLFNVIITIVLAVIDIVTGIGLLTGTYLLAMFIPGIAVSVRRLHDTGRSGWYMLIAWVPLFGPIVLLVFLAQDSQPGQNQYGANPKEATT
jgi:uncharacterized membrane protein YhaH (DUF805 family)